MKKQLIAVGLAGLLTIPAVSFGAEMAGPSLYGSFRTGLTFGSGDPSVADYASRWGIKGSNEVAEGLTASYKFEARMVTSDATTAGHRHDPEHSSDGEDNVNDSTGGGRLSYVSLSGGFGTVTLGQIWSASGVHYGFAVDPSLWFGSFGGSHYRKPNSVSYSSSAGDVTFQIDSVAGGSEDGTLEFGASTNLGPVGVGLGYWKNSNASFTGIAFSAGASGVDLTVGLGGQDTGDVSSETSILKIGGALGDSGVSYAVQVTNSDSDGGDQNMVNLTNSLGGGASIIFEHWDPGGNADSSSLLALRVDF